MFFTCACAAAPIARVTVCTDSSAKMTKCWLELESEAGRGPVFFSGCAVQLVVLGSSVGGGAVVVERASSSRPLRVGRWRSCNERRA